MKTVRESTTLYNFLESRSLYWRLTKSSDASRFSITETTEPDHTLQLPVEQTVRIREMTAITPSLMMSLTVDESNLPVHPVGRKINKREWAGNVSAWHDTSAATRDLSHRLSFTEQVVSEVRSAIVILDSRGNIQRFDRLCEDCTGLKEHDVIGQSVFKLLMSRRETTMPRRSNRVFFRGGNTYETELWIPTHKGQRLFLFRNKFVHSGSDKNEILLTHSGTDVTKGRRTQERLRILVDTDSITELSNRNAMQDLIDHTINHADSSKVGIVYLDLDNSKKVNNAHGHLFGDQLLRGVSLTVLGCLEHDQVLARPGGDEFLVLASNTLQSTLETMVLRILTRLRLPFCIGSTEVYTDCSVGIVLSSEHGSDSMAIIHCTDTAMYTAREGE